MPEVNYTWVNEQLAAAKVKIGSGKAVMALLEAWEKLPELSGPMKKEALEAFSKLAVSTPLVVSGDEPDAIWVPLQPGQITVGDTIRVLADAFDGKLGTIHNGRVGRVTAVRYGDVIVKSTDNKQPELNGVHYSPYKLEKRVR